MQGYNPYGNPMTPEARLTPEQQQQFDMLSPEQQQAFLAALMRDYGEEVSAADRQMTRADALRFNPQARGRQAGGMYVAAHPLEHVVDVLRHRKGGIDYGKAQTARQTALDDRADLRRQVAERLINRSDALRGMGY